MSVEDLAYDIKRLSTKIEILQNEKSSLEQELIISKKSNSGPSLEFTKEFEKTREKLCESRTTIVRLSEKYELVKSHLNMERISLGTIRSQLDNYSNDIQVEYKKHVARFADKILYLQEYIERISKQFDAALAKKIEDIKAGNDTILVLKSTIADREMRSIKLSKDINALQADSEKRFQEIQDNLVASTKSFQVQLAKKDEQLQALQETNSMLSDSIAANVQEINSLKAQQTGYQGKLTELTSINNSLVATTSTVSSKVHSQQLAMKELTEANEALKLSLLDAENKVQRAMTLNDSLQGDMKALLSREQSLRSEIGNTNVDKQEVYSRLASITSKLKSIEDDHKQEVDKLTSIIERLEREAVTTNRNCVQYKTMYDELQQMGSELKTVIQSKDAEIAALKAAESGVAKEIYRLKTDVEKWTSECTTLRTAQEGLRTERDEAYDARNQAQNELKSIQVKLNQATVALKDSEKDRHALSTQLSQSNPQMVPQLEEALRGLNQQLKEERKSRESEVEGLKDTIRRECEERIELLMEISDLKDQLLRWAGGSGAGGGGSVKRGAVDANHQTSHSPVGGGAGGGVSSRSAAGRLVASSSQKVAPSTSSTAYGVGAPSPSMDASNSSYSMGIVDSLDKTLLTKQTNSMSLEDSDARTASDYNWSEKFMKNPTAIAMNNKRHKRK